MAGYKTTIRTLDPALFMTFDGDAYDSASRLLTSVPAIVLDESPHGNHGIMQNSSSDPAFRGYRMGMPSMVPLEQAYNNSMSFGYYGPQNTPDKFVKSYIEINHTSSMDLDRQKGFTVMFTFKKSAFGDDLYGILGADSFDDPVIRKNGLFQVWWRATRYTGSYLLVRVKDVEMSLNVYDYTPFLGQNLYDREFHFAIVWDPVNSETGSNAQVRVYLDGLLVKTADYSGYDLYPDLTNTAPIEIGGLIGGSTINDRNKAPLQLDQIAFLKTALDSNMVGRLYKKTKSYQAMVKSHNPEAYFETAEINDPNNLFVGSSYGGAFGLGRYFGNVQTDIARYQPGPSNIPGSLGARLSNGGHLLLRRGGTESNSGSGSAWPTSVNNGGYSMEFYFSTSSNAAAPIFEQVARFGGYWGISLWVNRHNNAFYGGALQLQLNNKTRVSVTGQWNDGKWHHCAIVQRGTMLEIWLDGEKRGSVIIDTTVDSSGATDAIAFFNSSNGQTPGSGSISNIAFYRHPLQEQQITMRAAYLKIYRIRGQVTLRGQPYQANVRLMSHRTGELVKEVFSNSTTGDYVADLVDGRLIDIVVMNSQDPTIRYRVYGPVVPSEFADDQTG